AAGSFRGGGFVSRRRVRFAAAGSFRGGGFVSRRRVRFAAAGSGFRLPDYHPRMITALGLLVKAVANGAKRARIDGQLWTRHAEAFRSVRTSGQSIDR
ncbi:MAG: hypothetical protein AB7X49_22360, partial [Geminicoccaceae bacterium]